MISTVLLSRDKGVDIVTGRSNAQELGRSIIVPFQHESITSLKRQDGFSEALLEEGSVEEVETKNLSEWDLENEIHVVTAIDSDELTLVVSGRYDYDRTVLSKDEKGFVFMYHDNAELGKIAIDIVHSNQNWDVDVLGSGAVRCDKTEISESVVHHTFKSDLEFNEVSVVSERN